MAKYSSLSSGFHAASFSVMSLMWLYRGSSVSFHFFDGLLSADPPHADGTLEHDGDDGALPEGKALPDNTA